MKQKKSIVCSKTPTSKKAKVQKKGKAKKPVSNLRAKAISKAAKCPRYATVQPNGSSRPHVLKSEKQIAELEKEWKKSQNTQVKRIRVIAARLSLRPLAVYKWFWDRKRETNI